MLRELNKSDYARVRPLFRALAYQPFCTVVLAGLHPGRVLVDDNEHPKTACVIRDDGWSFLAGVPDNTVFNQALHTAIWERSIVDDNATVLLFTCEPPAWRAQLPAIFAPRKLVSIPRRHYICHQLAYRDWRHDIPPGFTVQRMDDTLLQRGDLGVPDDVRQTLDKWRTLDDPRLQDFGFVAIDDGDNCNAQIVAWATVDAIVEGTGDVGLFTLKAHRRRGLAAITTAAAVEYGLAHGMNEVSWTCAEYNIGSIRTAEKLGFMRERDYELYFLGLNEVAYLVNLAWNSLDTESYEATLEACDQFIARQEDVPHYIYFPAACAHAALGNVAQAFDHLNAALDKGFDELEELHQRKALSSLRDTSEWEAILTRIQSAQ
jgi:RimJ/RimL family protein N-acetyltransferase